VSAVLLDTGPLVAYLDRSERHHGWALKKFAEFSEPLWTCEPVLVEACFLLAHLPPAQASVGELLRRGLIRCPFALQASHQRVFALITRYRNVPMSIADACLVCMAEDHPQSRVFTLDADFAIYRLQGRKAVTVIAPDT
jgi:predicted nucleic acid-binding protein